MYNYFMIVGHIETDLEEDFDTVTVSSQRPFKDANGKIETDYFEISVPEPLKSLVKENFHQNQVIGFKGRLNPIGLGECTLIAERVINMENNSNY